MVSELRRIKNKSLSWWCHETWIWTTCSAKKCLWNGKKLFAIKFYQCDTFYVYICWNICWSFWIMCLYFDSEYALCWISVCLSFSLFKSSSSDVMFISEIPGIICTLLRTLKLKNIFPKKLEHYKRLQKLGKKATPPTCTNAPQKSQNVHSVYTCYEKLYSTQFILLATFIQLCTNAGVTLILMANTHGSQAYYGFTNEVLSPVFA